MNRNMDVVAQGIAAIGPFKLFIAARRQDADEEAARIQPKASVPPAPVWRSGSTAPLPLVTHTEEEEGEGAEKVRPAAAFASPRGSEIGVPPKVEAPTVPVTHAPSPTGHPSERQENALPITNTPRLVVEDATPPAGPSEVDSSETTVLADPPTVDEAWAQFEATWHMSQPETLPRVVREAYDGRQQAPDHFAQKLIGAVTEGLVPKAVEAAVATLIRVDPHFQEAVVLARNPNHAQLFHIELQEADYHAEDSTSPGEADRAALRGDEPF
jgi:hypothetical protein